MKRIFEIEYPDDCGPLWMNTSNLLLCLTQTCRNTVFTVRDVTGDGQANEAPETSGPHGPITRNHILEAVARGWCAPVNESKEMDSDLAEAITDSVLVSLYQ